MELPDNAVDDGYVDMTGNVLLSHMDESSAIHNATISDASGQSNNGTFTTNDGSTNKSTTGKLAKGITFDGTDDYIDFGNILNQTTNDFSLSAWIKTTSTNQYQAIISKRAYADPVYDGYRLWLYNSCGIGVPGAIINDSDTVGDTLICADTAVNDGEWHYVVATFDRDSVSGGKIYVDGVLENSVDITAQSNTITNTNNLRIGRGSGTDYYFAGTIDETAIWSRALSATEIQTIYRHQAPTYWELPDGGASQTEDWGGEMDMTGNKLLLHMNEASWNGTANEVADSSGQSNHGVRAGNATTTASGKISRGGTFDGSGDYVDIGNPASLSWGSADYSVCAWAKRTSTDTYDIIVAKMLLDIPYRGWYLRYNSNNKIEFNAGNYDDSFNNNGVVQSLAGYTNTEWHHICGVLDGGNSKVRLYYDGSEINSSAGSNTYNINNSASLWIGRKANGEDFQGNIDEAAIWGRVLSASEIKSMYTHQAPNYLGRFDSRIMNAGASTTWSAIGWTPQRPLYKELPNSLGIETAYNTGNADMTGNVLLMHMNEAGWNGTANEVTDNSGEGNHGTAYNGANTITNGKINRGGSFDGSNDYIRILNDTSFNFGTNENFTVMTWIKANYPQTDTGNTDNSIIEKWSGSEGYPFVIRFMNQNHASAGKISAAQWDGTNGTGLTSVSELKDNAYHHIVFTKNSSNLYLYVDGVLEDSDTDGTISSTANTSDLYLAHRGNNINHFGGVIDEVSIWSRALSNTEILDTFKRGALRLKYHVRSCNDSLCSGETFIGPDGTSATYYSELSNTGLGLPSFSLTNVQDNQYFQYRTFLESDTSFYSPELDDVTITYTEPPPSITDNDIGDFSAGADNNTQWDGTNTWVEQAPTSELPDNASASGFVSMANNILLLHMDENPADNTETISDSSGQGHHGALSTDNGSNNKSTYGKVDRGIMFDGTDDTISIPDNDAFTFSGDFTIMAWVNFGGTSGNWWERAFIAHDQGAGSNPKWIFTYNNALFFHHYNAGDINLSGNAWTPELNTWYHVAVVRDGNTYRFYKDGKTDGTAVNSTALLNAAAPVKIGFGEGTAEFNGKMDEIAIFSRALSASDLAAIYAEQAPTYWQLPDGGASQTEDWGGERDMTNNVLLLHMDETAGTIADTSGQGNNGTYNGALYSQAGRIGNAIGFDGSDDIITKANPTGLPVGGSARTIALWVKPNNSNPGGAFVHYGDSNGGSPSGGQEFIVQSAYASGATYLFTDGVNGSNNITISGSEIPVDNAWSHIVFTLDGSDNWAYYLNGALVKQGAFSVAINTATPVVLNIGDRGDYSAANYSGEMDEIAIFSEALTPTEIQSIYQHQKDNYLGRLDSRVMNAGSSTTWDSISWVPERPLYKELPDNGVTEIAYNSGNADMSGNVLLMHMNESVWNGTANEVIDSSGQENHGTRSGDATTTASGKFERAGTFDGVNDYVSVPHDTSMNATSELTMTAWVRLTNAATNQKIIGKSNMYSGYVLGVANNMLYPEIWDSTGSGSGFLAGSIPSNEWIHLAVTWKANGSYIGYINGSEVYSGSASSNNIGTNSTNLVIGSASWDYQWDASGAVDEVALFTRELTADEILNLYLRGATRLKYHVRSCNDSACSGETFIGPDGTAETYYSELTEADLGLPKVSFTNLSANQYLQYRAFLESDISSYSPELNEVSVSYELTEPSSGKTTLAGITNSAPLITETVSDGGSDSSTPTDQGDDIAFTATATDINGDQYYLAICKTDSITVGNDTAPTCATDQTWAITAAGSPVNSNAEATVTYTAQGGDAESNAWYAFACDKLATADGPACFPAPANPGGDQGRAIGIITFTGIPADGDNITIDSVTYEFDTNDSYSNTQVDISGARVYADAADALVTAEAGSNSFMDNAAAVVYIYASAAGVSGNSIGMTEGQDTNNKIDFSGATLTGGDDDNASPFYVNHAGTFGTAYIGDATDAADIKYPDGNGVKLTAVSTGPAGNELNIIFTDDDLTDCTAETAASLAALILGASPDFTLTCDLNDSLQSGANPVTGTRLAAAITDGTGTAIDDVITAAASGTGASVMTAGTASLNNIIPGDTLTFTLPSSRIADSDTEGGQDTMTMHVCAGTTTSFNYTTNLCDGTTAPVCSSSAVDPTSTDATCTESANNLVPPGTADGDYNVKIYVEDNHNLPAAGTNTQSYTVRDPLPTLLAYSAAENPAPPAGGYHIVNFSVTVEDLSGEGDITAVNAVFFDSAAVTNSCTADDNDCYLAVYSAETCGAEANCCNISTVYGNEYQIQADCQVKVYFNANASTVWKVQAEAVDGNGTTELANLGDNLINPALLGMTIVQASIPYGTLASGEVSSGQTTTIGNMGNQTIDFFVEGEEMSCTENADCIANPISVGQQKWHHESAAFAWSSTPSNPGPYTLVDIASGTDDETGCLNRDIAVRPVNNVADTNESIYWILKIPDEQPTGTYTGANAFSVASGGTCTAGQSY